MSKINAVMFGGPRDGENVSLPLSNPRREIFFAIPTSIPPVSLSERLQAPEYTPIKKTVYHWMCYNFDSSTGVSAIFLYGGEA